eukprot:c22156_g1_i2 orf=522-686(+)
MYIAGRLDLYECLPSSENQTLNSVQAHGIFCSFVIAISTHHFVDSDSEIYLNVI